LPKAAVALELEQGRLGMVRVEGWPLRRMMTVVHHQQKYLSKALLAFLEEMKKKTERRR